MPLAFHHSGFFGALALILQFGALALLFAVFSQQKAFQTMVVLIGIRFLIIYFEVFRSLAYSGFGLIFSGLLIIASAYSWIKFRVKFTAWLQERI